MKRRLLLGGSLLAMYAATTPSLAQDGPPSAALTGLGRKTSGIEDITVTATKVRTNVQKTPVAITTVGARTLRRAGVTNPQELNKLVGGLQVEQNGPGASFFIRGVGSRTLAPTQDPGVAFSVDGVYYNRTLGAGPTFFDISRVEVVKGPQGTLYGRNATGGAVNLITSKPAFDKPHVDLSLEVGNYGTVRFNGAVTAPLSDTVAVRLAGESNSHNGYFTDGYNDEDVKGVRPSLTWKPNSDLTVYLSGDYEHEGGMGPGVVPAGPGGNNNALKTRFAVPGNPWTGPSDAAVNNVLHVAAPAGALPFPGPGVFCVGVPIGLDGPPMNVPGGPAVLTCNYPLGVEDITRNGYLRNSYYGTNLTVEDNLGFADLTAIGGYRGTDVNSFFRVDPTTQSQLVKADQGSVEVRLSSRPDAGKLKWLVGGFWLQENQRSAAQIDNDNSGISNPVQAPGSPLPPTACLFPIGPGVCLTQVTAIQKYFNLSDPDLFDQTYAGFGQVIYSVLPWFRLSGGIRYTHELKSETAGTITEQYTLPQGASISYPSKGSASFNNVSYRGGIEIDAAPRSLLYASVSTGFHAGGFNLGVENGPNRYVYQPEKVINYVVGSKNRLFNNQVQLNVEGFWLDYDNYQTQSLGRVNDGSFPCSTLRIEQACPFTLRIDNAATATSRGVETDVIWRPIDNGTFNANILYNDTEFAKFQLANPFNGAITDYSHTNLPGASRWTVTAGYSQDFPLPNDAVINATVSTVFKNNTWMFYQHAPGNYQPAYTRTDISVSYQAPSKRWDITGFVRNVENHATLLEGTTIDPVTNLPWVNLNPPRTFGVILSIHT